MVDLLMKIALPRVADGFLHPTEETTLNSGSKRINYGHSGGNMHSDANTMDETYGSDYRINI